MISYRKATKNDLDAVAHLAAQSFGDYPFFSFALRSGFDDDTAYRAYLEKLFRIHIKANMRAHHCFVGVLDGKIVSTALLQDPEKGRVTIGQYILSGGVRLIHPVGFSRILDFFSISEQAHADCARTCPDAWYLELLAVDSDMKGQHLGSDMIQDCLIPFVQSNTGKQLALITNTDQNRKFYLKNGFQEFSQCKLRCKDKTIGNWSFLQAV